MNTEEERPKFEPEMIREDQWNEFRKWNEGDNWIYFLLGIIAGMLLSGGLLYTGIVTL
jgi:hypothetical protein